MCVHFCVKEGSRICARDPTSGECFAYIDESDPGFFTTASSDTRKYYTARDPADSDDQCKSNPCANEALCVDEDNSHKCVCRQGFSGANCDQYTGCESNPCVNGTCIAETNSFRCNCSAGYGGTRCDSFSLQSWCTMAVINGIWSLANPSCISAYSDGKEYTESLSECLEVAAADQGVVRARLVWFPDLAFALNIIAQLPPGRYWVGLRAASSHSLSPIASEWSWYDNGGPAAPFNWSASDLANGMHVDNMEERYGYWDKNPGGGYPSQIYDGPQQMSAGRICEFY